MYFLALTFLSYLAILTSSLIQPLTIPVGSWGIEI